MAMGCTPGGGSDMGMGDMSMLPDHCSNGMKDVDESDVDCGGSCAQCAGGKKCAKGSDCASTFCTNGLCDAPSCNDGIKNGNETDLDCGGGMCPGCAIGKMCKIAIDCASLTCTNGLCATSQCMDGKKNGTETDTDCGGGTCPTCADGKMCMMGTDCMSGTCTNNICVGAGADGGVDMSSVTCKDAVQNGSETDVDCGGGTCPKCPLGKMCLMPADCQSGVCTGNKCVPGMALKLSFAKPVPYPGAAPIAIVQADFNLDGNIDIAVDNRGMGNGTGNISVFLGKGDGTFGAAIQNNTLTTPDSLVVADFNGDKKPDLFVHQQNAAYNTLFGDGTGAFAAPVLAVSSSANSMGSAGDFSGDGKADVVLGFTAQQNNVVALVGDGKGGFASDFMTTNDDPIDVRAGVAGDWNGDGKSDVAFAVRNNNIQVLLNNGNWANGNVPGFTAQPEIAPLANYGPSALAVGDLNGDKKLDLVSTMFGAGGKIAVLLGKGDGTFQMASTIDSGSSTVLALADFDGDGNVDVAATDGAQVDVFLGKGDGTLQPFVSIQTGGALYDLVAADLNKDGKPDLVAVDFNAGIDVLLNTSM